MVQAQLIEELKKIIVQMDEKLSIYESKSDTDISILEEFFPDKRLD